jgi:hypothetical protein
VPFAFVSVPVLSIASVLVPMGVASHMVCAHCAPMCPGRSRAEGAVRTDGAHAGAVESCTPCRGIGRIEKTEGEQGARHQGCDRRW